MTFKTSNRSMRYFVYTAFALGSLMLTPVGQTAEDYTEIFNKTTSYPDDVQLVDFNRDGNLDLLAFDYDITGVVGSGNPSVMYQYTGNGDGTFTELATVNFRRQGGSDHTLADFNADGYTDLLHGDIYPGYSDGTFASVGISTDLPFCRVRLVRDMNSDGLNDVICEDYVNSLQDYHHFVYINQGNFVFVRSTMLPIMNTDKTVADAIAQGDLNGDGTPDVVRVETLVEGPNYTMAGHIVRTNLVNNNGFSEAIEWTTDELHDASNRFATNGVSDMKLGDFNNDGNLDLLAMISGYRTTPDASLVVYPGDGTGYFSREKINTTIGNTLSKIGDLQVVDMNDDSKLDLVISYLRTGNANPQLNIAVYHGNGDGTFKPAQEVAPELANVIDTAVGDVDGDGQLDIAAVAGWDFGTIAVFSRNANSVVANRDDSCLFAGSDSDGDGWGWESGESCRVTEQSMPGVGNTTNTSVQSSTVYPTCQRDRSDPDGDGWGWENGESCIASTSQPSTAHPACLSAQSDSDGDGWGWENNQSCIVSQ